MRRSLFLKLLAASLMAVGFTSLTAAQPFVYVPMGSDDKIVVIDAANDQVVNTIIDIPAAHGLAATPDGNLLIAGSFDAHEAGTKPKKPTSVSEADHNAHHTAKPSDPADTTSNLISTVSIIRRLDQTIIGAVDVPGAVHHVAVNPDSQYAAVTLPGEDGISVIDLAALAVIANTKTGSLPNYVAFSPDGNSLYVSNAGDGTVAIVDSSKWRVQATITVGDSPEHLALSKGGDRLYVNNVDDGTVSEIDLNTKAVKRTFKIGGTLHGIGLTDDDRFLFVADLENDQIARVDLGEGTVAGTALSPEPYHLAAIPNTNKLYVTSASDPILWVVDPASMNVVSTIDIGGMGHQITFSPGT